MTHSGWLGAISNTDVSLPLKSYADLIRGTGVTEYFVGVGGSLLLDARKLDHLGPLFGFLDDELAELGGRADKRCASEVGEPRLHRGIGESRIDLFVECVDDLGGRVPGCAEAVPRARLKAWQEL